MIFEMLGELCPEADTATRVYLYDKLNEHRVEVKTDTKVLKIDQETIYCECKGEETVFSDIDVFVIAMGYVPRQGLKKALTNMGIGFYEVGDCREVSDALDGIRDAFWLAKSI